MKTGHCPHCGTSWIFNDEKVSSSDIIRKMLDHSLRCKDRSVRERMDWIEKTKDKKYKYAKVFFNEDYCREKGDK